MSDVTLGSPNDVTPIYAFGSRMIEAFQVAEA